MKKLQPMTYARIDLSALRANLKEIQRLVSLNSFALPYRRSRKKKLVDPEHILTVIKAEAYGHGIERVARELNKLHVGYLGVSDVREGIQLRQMAIKKNIVLFETALAEQVPLIVAHDLIPTVGTLELAAALNRQAQLRKKRIKIHIKVDTGMGRLGIWHEDAFNFVSMIHYMYRNLVIDGLYTHFPSADTDERFTRRQMEHMYQLVLKLDRNALIIPFVHASNSMGLAGYKTNIFNLFRPGLMLYGLYPHPRLKTKLRLKPVMSVHSRVIFLKRIERGRSISYGRTFVAKKAMTVATIPIGYSDGYFRNLSHKAQVLIGGRRCPVLGRVTMDQIVVDVTGVKNARIGTPVVIMGQQGSESIGADELAIQSGTISYEVVCALGNNLPRQYVS